MQDYEFRKSIAEFHSYNDQEISGDTTLSDSVISSSSSTLNETPKKNTVKKKKKGLFSALSSFGFGKKKKRESKIWALLKKCHTLKGIIIVLFTLKELIVFLENFALLCKKMLKVELTH